MPDSRSKLIPPDKMERLILARQLELLSAPTLVTVIGMPVWALIACVFASGLFKTVGQAEMSLIVTWFGLIMMVCAGTYAVDRAYQKAKLEPETFDAELWGKRYSVSLAALSAVWASLIWWLWLPDNQINQIGLTVFVISGIMNGIVSRLNKFDCFMYGTGAAFFILWLRHATTLNETSLAFASFLPLLFVALLLNVRSASGQMRANIKSQIENEFLKEENALALLDAERANKMKSNFLANMSHELRTPLNAVLGFSEIIASQAFGPNANDKYKDYAGDIHASGKHLLSMINSLLDIAKIEAGKAEVEQTWFECHRVVAESARLVESRASEKNLSLLYALDPATETIWGDEKSFKQILINLLSNAVKFTSSGWVRVTLETKQATVILSVEDTGFGIPDSQIARVFEAFEQVDNRYTKENSGTGLGLTLVRALARLNGGDCSIESNVGQGTKVSVFFPQAERSSQASSSTARSRVA